MRIVVDMQGAQSTGSRHRGIGRYTLSIVQALVRQRCSHDIHLVLNGQFSETITPLREAFEGLLSQAQIHVWQGLSQVSYTDWSNQERRETNELIYEAFLSGLEPDFIYITSLFEGLSDDAVTSVHRLQSLAPVAVTLYDLIPLMNPDLYLESPIVKAWYQEKIEHLKRADVWLAISESSRQEGVTHLNLPLNRTHNISTDADDIFQKITVSTDAETAIRKKYRIEKPFVMYTGGLDHRKNVEGLIHAYALLPQDIREHHQLAIVCALQPTNRKVLEKLANKLDLGPQAVVLTGFVSDEELLTLYNLCKLFIFPSWHEGFGLPALEATRCGAPVIGANISSLPEVIGWEQALFDPYDHGAMTKSIARGLTDKAYRHELIERATVQSQQFSWDESARRAIAAMQAYWHESNGSHPSAPHHPERPERPERAERAERPLLAFVSPLPGAHSGIADYSADLLPELSKYYDIEVVVEQAEAIDNPWISNNVPIRSSSWFAKNANRYARVLYHFGNSAFHQHMFDLLENIPGVVVLHDFFLSGIQAYRDANGHRPDAWAAALFASHGYQALKDRFETTNTADVIFDYPANLPVLQRAQGIVVHSPHSIELAQQWYGEGAAKTWVTIPLLRTPPNPSVRATARQVLGYQPDDVLICSFGGLASTKLSDRVLKAWLDSELSRDRAVHLIFVGQNDEGAFGHSLQQRIDASAAKDRIKITGWTSADEFKQYLVAADVGVQLRTLSRGETSAAVLDCLNHGVATIVNAHGSMKALDPHIVCRLPDEFTDEALTNALVVLARDPHQRAELGERAQRFIRQQHDPAQCARQYVDAIEKFHARSSNGLARLLNEIEATPLPTAELFEVAEQLAVSFPPVPRQRQLLVDVSGLLDDHPERQEERNGAVGAKAVILSMLQRWIKKPPAGYRVEPVYVTEGCRPYRYARQFTLQLLGILNIDSDDSPVDAWPDDIFVGLSCQPNITPRHAACLRGWRARGINVWFVIDDDLMPLKTGRSPSEPPSASASESFSEPVLRWLETASEFDGVACTSETAAGRFSDWLAHHAPKRSRPLKVEWFSPLTSQETDKIILAVCSSNEPCGTQHTS